MWKFSVYKFHSSNAHQIWGKTVHYLMFYFIFFWCNWSAMESPNSSRDGDILLFMLLNKQKKDRFGLAQSWQDNKRKVRLNDWQCVWGQLMMCSFVYSGTEFIPVLVIHLNLTVFVYTVTSACSDDADNSSPIKRKVGWEMMANSCYCLNLVTSLNGQGSDWSNTYIWHQIFARSSTKLSLVYGYNQDHLLFVGSKASPGQSSLDIESNRARDNSRPRTKQHKTVPNQYSSNGSLTVGLGAVFTFDLIKYYIITL